MKRFLSLVLIVALLVSVLPSELFPVTASAATSYFAGGDGTEDSPYLISTKTHLYNVRGYRNAHFKLTRNIVFSNSDFSYGGSYYNNGAGWAPIGTSSSYAFTGTFDGNGFSIINLRMWVPSSNTTSLAGLFGYNEGTIKNLCMDAGLLSSSNSSSYSYVSASTYAGSIVGENHGTIENCYTTATVSASSSACGPASYAGGIAGYNKGTITNCYNAGKVSASARSTSSISEYAWAYAGGIVGSNSGTVSCCYNIGTVTASASATKPQVSQCGIAGSNKDTVKSCYFLETNNYEGSGAIRCSAEQLAQQSTYTGFDFENVWEMNPAIQPYPMLKSIHYHMYSNTCDSACDECGYSRTPPHSYEWIIDKENTCGLDGIKHEECVNCHIRRNENTSIAATGNHSYTDICDSTCNVCEYLRTAPHNYEWIIDKETSCAGDGIKHEECSLCHAMRNVDTVIPAPPHTYTNNTDAVCDICNFARYYVSYDLNGGSNGPENIWVETGSVRIGEQTPTKPGNIFYGWQIAGEDSVIYHAGDTISLHDSICLVAVWITNCTTCNGDGIEEYTEACATCDGKGTVLSTTACSTCGGDGRYNPTISVTCTACNGTGNKTSLCGFCAGYGGYFTYKCSSGHSTTSKYRQYSCSICGSYSISETIHTCSTCGGYGTVNKCSTCGGDGKTTESGSSKTCPSCSGIGYPTRDCTACVGGNVAKTRTCSVCSGNGMYQTPTAPVPVLQSCDQETVVLQEISNGEYSMDGITWQKSPVFTNLEAGKEYHFYQRYGKTDTTLAGASSPALTVIAHDHVYDHACDAICNICPLERSVPDHVYDNACDVACNVCGAERTVTDHVYDNACDAHCNECDAMRTVPDHIYDNVCDADCNVCGATRTVPDHIYDNACDANCNECGAIRPVYEHVYDHSCDTDCNICGLERSISHTYDNACDAQCNVCAATRVPGDHQYDHACDTECNECGQSREITHTYCGDSDTKCDVCGYIRTVSVDSYYEYSVSNGKATITGVISSISGDIVIPATLNGHRVVAIGDNTYGSGFYNCDQITSVTIPEGISHIGAAAFYSCGNLVSVSIPSSITSVGEQAFYSCNQLTKNTYDNATYLGNSEKPYLVLLQAISTDTASCTIHPDTKVIYHSAFERCNLLQSISIPNGVIEIGVTAFERCNNLTEIAIPDSVISLGDSAFYYCKNLQNATIGNGVTRIGAQTFYMCDNLSTVSIGSSVQSMGDLAFYACEKLAGVYITDVAAWCHIDFDNTSANPLSYANNLYVKGQLASTLTIPMGVTGISDYAFYNCDSITAVTIPNSATEIGQYAFSCCDSLTKLTIGNHVATIAHYAFDDCDSLSGVTIPNSVTTVGKYAFRNCNSLTQLTIGEGVTSIAAQAFYNCSNLETITFNAIMCTSIGSGAFGKCSNVKTITIGENVHRLLENVFNDCTKLETVNYNAISFSTSSTTNPTYSYYYGTFIGFKSIKQVTIGEKVKHLPDNLFKNCTGLEVVRYNVINSESVSGSMFDGCTNLRTVYFGKNVTDIPSYLFRGCKNLTRVTMPNTIWWISSCAFEDCINLQTVYYKGTESQWNEIQIQDYNDPLLNANIIFAGEGNIPGDLNGDDNVNNEDVAYLLWYTLFPEDYPIDADVDFTGDGNINNEDVAYLLWHTLFPEDYPL